MNKDDFPSWKLVCRGFRLQDCQVPVCQISGFSQFWTPCPTKATDLWFLIFCYQSANILPLQILAWVHCTKFSHSQVWWSNIWLHAQWIRHWSIVLSASGEKSLSPVGARCCSLCCVWSLFISYITIGSSNSMKLLYILYPPPHKV